jgi:adenosylcobinamide-GDP ribazoletransferase
MGQSGKDTPPMETDRLRDQMLSALALLTRFPLPDHGPSGAASAWAWPLVGGLLGAIAALLASTLLTLGVPPGPAAAATLAALALMTGALHEDGLADSADGLLGGRTRERRLEIMRDSRIGSFGALALGLVLLSTWSALVPLLESGQLWGALIAASALSRAAMVAVMAALPPARPGGLSASTGRPEPALAALACGIALTLAVLTLGSGALAPTLAAALLPALLAWAATRLIGGQTGDILGASQQLAFAGALALIA